MAQVKERLDVARSALSALESALMRPTLSDLERDGAIQRFEFTWEAVLRAAQTYLFEYEKISVASPKNIIRALLQAGLLDEQEAHNLLTMADDRNLTVHTYNEKFAQALFARLPNHLRLLQHLFTEIETRTVS